MSRSNRERRAAKQKARRRAAGQEHVRGVPEFDRAALQVILAEGLRSAAQAHCFGDEEVAEQCAAGLVDEFGAYVRDLDIAADLALGDAVRAAWEAGWLPGDLHEIGRRRLDPSLVALLVDAIADEARRYPAATVHPRWRDALRGIPAEVWWSADAPLLRQWADRHGWSRVEALAAVVEVLAVLLSLPVLERLLPLPGEARHAVEEPGGEVDQKVLARVRALLAKAESTEFPEEAEALSAKAQELMSRYSLHRAVAEHDRGAVPTVSGRRMWVDTPYPGAKALLVQAVGTPNRCRTVWMEKPGFVTVLGAETDLDIVELLTTSLLVQANRAMMAEGRQVTRSGVSRTRSFRQSFLIAYATRIGERLDVASAAGAAEVGDHDRLLPVLAARSRAADEMTDRLFPTLVSHAMSVTNAAGWGAGRAAADMALFDVHRAVAG